MIKFAIKRAISAIILLLVFSFFVFLIIDLSSGNIVFGLYGDNISALNPHVQAKIMANLGLDRPFLQRYIEWILNLFHGDFGYSLVSGEKVSQIVQDRLPYSLLLGTISFFFSFVLSVFLGSISAIYKGSFLDRAILILTLSFFSIPSFWLGIICIMVFSIIWTIFPASGLYDLGKEGDIFNLIQHLIMPVFVLSVAHLAIYVRLVRNSFIEALKQPFITSFTSWGVKKNIINYKLALRYALIPVISYFGATTATIVTGTYIVESVFSIGGLGSITMSSLLAKDYPVALIIILISTFFVVFVNFLVEIIEGCINPKLKYESI